jgi:hypothetical protein
MTSPIGGRNDVVRLVKVISLSLVVSFAVYAQATGGTLTGTVSDPSGAVILNAKIIIKDVATTFTRAVSTNAAGVYSAPNLLPGIYQVTVSAPGFATLVRSGLTVTVGAQQALNITMQIGKVNQSVEVTGEAPAVQLATSTLSNEVTGATVRELPLNGRDWTQLATLQPGVTSLASEQLSITGSTSQGRGNRGFGTQLTISGGRPQQNNYRLDGISINDYANSSPGDVLGAALGVDAIEEFSVLTSDYSAEYGRTSGGVVNAITRSGTNQFHGDAYDFLRNSALDAANFIDNSNGVKKPPFRRNQFGGSAGGPIWKDRTFVFGDYEGLRQSLGVTAVDTVPSLDARKGILHNADGTTTTIPGGVDSLVKPFLALWATPTGGVLGTGNTGVFSFAAQQIVTENFVTARVDHKFSEADNLSGSLQWVHALSTLPDGLNDTLTGQNTSRQFVALEETHTFSPQLINAVRGGFNRVAARGGYGVRSINPVAADPSLSAIPGRDAPKIQVSGLTPFNGSINSVDTSTFNWTAIQGYDDAFLTKGIQSLKFGIGVERDHEYVLQNADVGGTFVFGSLANFLTNTPQSLAAAFPSKVGPRNLRQTIFGAYIQDDVRWRPNLTLNLGLRYEMSTVPTETQNKLSDMRKPTDTAPHLGDPFFFNPTLRNFEPRVGFAWDPFRNGMTSVRGGFGIFDVLPLTYEYALVVDGLAPFALQGSATSPSLPQGSFPQKAISDLAALSLLHVAYVQPNPHRNYVMQWNFNVQRQLRSDLTAMVAYVGSRGVHQLFRADDMNLVMPTLTPAGYLWPSPLGSGTVLNPNFGRIDNVTWGSNSFYDALELQILKRMSHGFQIEGSYTWGKSIDEGSGSLLGDPFANGISSLFWFDRRLRRGVSDFNVSQNLVINYTWNVPAPKSLEGGAGWAVGGWQLGGIFQARTGLHFTPILGGDALGTNSSDPWDFPSRLLGPGCQSAVNPGNPSNYIKLNCFSVPMPTPSIAAACTPFSAVPGSCSNLLGNAGRNSLIGPGLLNFDFSLFKNNYIKRISENFNVQFRAEFFNIFNHPNFASPTDNQTLFDQSGAPVPGAGLITATSTTAREIQLALKVIW